LLPCTGNHFEYHGLVSELNFKGQALIPEKPQYWIALAKSRVHFSIIIGLTTLANPSQPFSPGTSDLVWFLLAT